MSPRSTSTPWADNCGYSPRPKLRTWSPRASSASTMYPPKNPPPPVTSACISRDSLLCRRLEPVQLQQVDLVSPLRQLLAPNLRVVADIDRKNFELREELYGSGGGK